MSETHSMKDDQLLGNVDPRVRLAAERTLLAWVRTGLAMMGFGFVVARFGLFLRELAATGHSTTPQGNAQWIGILLVLVGVVTNLAAAYQHVHFLRRLERGDANLFPRWSLSLIMTVIVAVVGIGMAIYLLTKANI
jgi:inner membrane protein YidH